MMNRDKLIMAWIEAKDDLGLIKKLEANLKKQVLAECFETSNGGEPISGTQNVELGKGYTLKASFSVTYKLDKGDKVKEFLSMMQPEFAEKLVKWEPKLDKKVYESLDEASKAKFDEVITTTQAAPTLAFIEPKGD